MRKRRLWWRLFISYLWVPVVVLLSVGWYGSDVVRDLYEEPPQQRPGSPRPICAASRLTNS